MTVLWHEWTSRYAILPSPDAQLPWWTSCRPYHTQNVVIYLSFQTDFLINTNIYASTDSLMGANANDFWNQLSLANEVPAWSANHEYATSSSPHVFKDDQNILSNSDERRAYQPSSNLGNTGSITWKDKQHIAQSPKFATIRSWPPCDRFVESTWYHLSQPQECTFIQSDISFFLWCNNHSMLNMKVPWI